MEKLVSYTQNYKEPMGKRKPLTKRSNCCKNWFKSERHLQNPKTLLIKVAKSFVSDTDTKHQYLLK